MHLLEVPVTSPPQILVLIIANLSKIPDLLRRVIHVP